VASAHRIALTEAVVAADRGHAVVAGAAGTKVRLARLDRYGRPVGMRTIGTGAASDFDIALAGDHVAVASRDARARANRSARRAGQDRPAVRGRVGDDALALAVAPSGAAILAYAPLGDEHGPGTIRAAVISAADVARTVSLGKGYLEGAIADEHDRGQVIWSTFGPEVVKSATVPLDRRRLPRRRTVARGCFGEPDAERGNRFEGDLQGRLVAHLVCGTRQRPSVVRLPAS
jgi:hypothetical protein